MKCFCQECNRKWHFRPASSGDNLNFCFKGPSFGDSTTNDSSQGGGSPISDRSKHDLGLICEECERAKRTVYCIECDQGFCDECHSHIHRKGNRVLHKKTSLSRSEDYKILLNLVWIEGSATHSADLVNLERVLQVTGVTVQKAYTSVHVAGPVSHELSQLLNRLELQFATAPKMRGLSEAFIDFIVKKFDAAVFMNEIIIMSPEPLPEETRESLQRLYPSSRVKELRMSPPACSEEYHLQGEESKDLDKQQQSVGMAGSECSNQFGCRDSKDIDNDAVILHPETPTPNSSNTGTLQNSSSKGDAKFSRHPAGSRRVVPVPFTNLGEHSSQILTKDVLVDSLPGVVPEWISTTGNWKYKRSRKNFEIRVLATEKFLSSELGPQQVAEIYRTGDSLADFAEVLYGLKELRHASNNIKNLVSTLGKNWQKPLPLDHKYNDKQLEGSLQTNLSLVVQQMMVAYALEGDILVDYNQILRDVIEVTKLSETDAQNILLRMSDLNIIIINTRQVTQSQSLNLVSLKLEFITLENLYWVIKSLLLDRVTPSEEILIARIKEAFGLKLKPKSWSKVFEKFYEILNTDNHQNSKHSQILSNIEITVSALTGTVPTANHGLSQKIFVFRVKDVCLEPEDSKDIPDHHPEWEYFKNYLDKLFETDLLLYNQSSSNTDMKATCNILDKPIYRGQGSVSDPLDTDKSLSGRDRNPENPQLGVFPIVTPDQFQDSCSVPNAKANDKLDSGEKSEMPISNFKAISGGRYGMAQFIKFFGPPRLSNLSIGFLSKLVQKSIELGLLKYYKTFLLKTEKAETETGLDIEEPLPSQKDVNDGSAANQNDSKGNSWVKSNTSLLNLSQGPTKPSSVPTKELNSDFLSKIRGYLVEVLLEKDNHFPLAQLVDTLSQRLGGQFDPKELGYTKLVNFIEHNCSIVLTTVHDIIDISRSSRNHYILSLKQQVLEAAKRLSTQDLDKSYQPILTDLSKEFPKAKQQPPSTDQIHAAQAHHIKNMMARKGQQDRKAAHTSLNMNFAGSFTRTSTSWIAENYKLNFSTIEDYMSEIKKQFEKILKSHSKGIDGRDLHRLISQSIGTEFDPRIFECQNMHEFIVNHFRAKVDIQLIENKVSGMLEVFYFPKNLNGIDTRKGNIFAATANINKDKLNPLSAQFNTPESMTGQGYFPLLSERQQSDASSILHPHIGLGGMFSSGHLNQVASKHKRYSTIGNTQTLQTISESNKLGRIV